MYKTINRRRAQLKGELKQRVAEEVEHFIVRHPGAQIPNTAIADKFGINAHQVHTATDYLLRNNRLEKTSFKTYTVPMYERDIDKPLLSIPVVEEPQVATNVKDSPSCQQIVDLAKTFKWETDSDSLREFVRWLNGDVINENNQR